MSKAPDGFISTLAGGIAGAVEAFSVQPFDMVKTRHQLNVGKNEGVLKSLQSIYREGGFSRFYRGMSAELIGIIPKSSAMYASYAIIKHDLDRTRAFGDSGTLNAAIAGCGSGVSEATIVTPTQVIKVRLQAKEHLGKYSGPIDCIQKVIRTEGVSALAIGLVPTLWRNCVWNTVYFGTMHWLKDRLPSPASKSMETMQTLVVGFAGAVFATCFNAPFDVVKSRFQSQLHVPGQALKYTSTFPTLLMIIREEGIASVYKGFRPKAIRMGLGGAVAMAAFDLTMHFAQ